MRSRAVLENWIKRDDRKDVDLPATAIRADGTSMAVTLRNISYEGCQLEADAVLLIGERITLALPRMGEIKTQIRWATVDGKAGARFIAEEISAEEQHSRVGL